jgi:methyl acetate hydrolase
MSQEIARRDLLKGAATLAVPVLARSWSSPATAAKAGAASRTAKYRSGVFGSIDRTLQRAVDERQVTGVVAMGATDKGSVYEGSFGKRDVAHGPGMSLDTVFWLLSMTKTVTETSSKRAVGEASRSPRSELLRSM